MKASGFLSVATAMITPMAEQTFTDEHRDILDFERAWWKYAGAKEGEIHERFGITAVRYYQLLNWIIDQPQALEHDPLGVRRLRRLRDERSRRRSARRLGFEAVT